MIKKIYFKIHTEICFLLHMDWEVHFCVILGSLPIILFNIKSVKLDLRMSNYNLKIDILMHITLTIRVIILVKYHLLTVMKLK